MKRHFIVLVLISMIGLIARSQEQRPIKIIETKHQGIINNARSSWKSHACTITCQI